MIIDYIIYKMAYSKCIKIVIYQGLLYRISCCNIWFSHFDALFIVGVVGPQFVDLFLWSRAVYLRLAKRCQQMQENPWAHRQPPHIYTQSENAKIFETGIPNDRWISVFTICLSNFVYWVGFVTGISSTTHLRIMKFVDFLTCWENQPLSLGCYF